MSIKNENQQAEAAQPASNRRRALLSAALKSTPYALTLASGSALANTSAFQCMQNNRNELVAGKLDNEQAKLTMDHYVRFLVPEFTIDEVIEQKQDVLDDKEQPVLDDEGNQLTEWVIVQTITRTIYITGTDINNEGAWYEHTYDNTNRLVPAKLSTQSSPDKQSRWEGSPSGPKGNVYVLGFFKPNDIDTGLTNDYKKYPDVDTDLVVATMSKKSGDMSGEMTVLADSCMCSVNPDYASCP